MPKPPFESEAKCEAIDMKMIFFYSRANVIDKKGFALSLVLKSSFWNSEMAYSSNPLGAQNAGIRLLTILRSYFTFVSTIRMLHRKLAQNRAIVVHSETGHKPI